MERNSFTKSKTFTRYIINGSPFPTTNPIQCFILQLLYYYLTKMVIINVNCQLPGGGEAGRGGRGARPRRRALAGDKRTGEYQHGQR